MLVIHTKRSDSPCEQLGVKSDHLFIANKRLNVLGKRNKQTK